MAITGNLASYYAYKGPQGGWTYAAASRVAPKPTRHMVTLWQACLNLEGRPGQWSIDVASAPAVPQVQLQPTHACRHGHLFVRNTAPAAALAWPPLLSGAEAPG
eukprot:scaffold14091_cov121-Isochrysis_galbana.AAC.12